MILKIKKSAYFIFILFIFILVFSYASINKTKLKSISPDAIRFISFGDNPHVPEGEVENYLKMVLDSINKHDPSLVIHVGDTVGGREPCTNSMIDLQKKVLNSINAPVIYTPGDNEWRDCYQEKKGEVYDNLDRLNYIRKTYFSNNQTLGKNPIDIENQGKAGFPENSRLMIDNVAFITAHVIGSNNNFDPSNERNTNEFKKRDVANINWIKDSFKKYEKASAYVVAIHADMYSEGSTFSPVYEKFGLSLYNLSNDYNKPVLILYGDSHEYKNFQPMKENYPLIYAIENYGNPDINALLIEVDTSKKNPFIVVKVIKGESTKTWILRNLRRVERKLLSLIS